MGSSSPHPESSPGPLHWKATGNHWTTREVQGDGFSFLQEGQGDFHWGRERRVRTSEDQAGEIPLGQQGEGGQEPRETELLGSVQGQWGVENRSVPPKEDGYRVFPGRSDGGNLGQGS